MKGVGHDRYRFSQRQVRLRLLPVVLLAAMLSGCAMFEPWTHVSETQKLRDRGGLFTAEVPRDWMRSNVAGYFLVTKDGVALDQISVQRVRYDDELEFTKRRFRAGMLPQELAEVELDNMRSHEGIANLTVIENRPATMDGEPAYYLEYTYTLPGGLEMRDVQSGFATKQGVYRILYRAAAQHYFDRYRPTFERFIETWALIR